MSELENYESEGTLTTGLFDTDGYVVSSENYQVTIESVEEVVNGFGVKITNQQFTKD